MLHNRPLALKVSNRKDLFLLFGLLYLLVVLAALLSPQPIFLTALAVLIFGPRWAVHTLKKHKTSTVKLILVIFPDGRVRLESDQQGKVEGFLEGQQWCTRWFAVLRVAYDDTIRTLLIRSAQQPGVDDFRRLNMWLRQDLFSSTRQGRYWIVETRETGSE